MGYESMSTFLYEPSFFKALADSSPLFIGMWDMSLRPFYLNEAGRRLVGLADQGNCVEASVNAFFFPEDQDFVLNEFFPRVLREGRAETEIRFRHFKTGEAVWMIYDVFFLSNDEGAPVGLATVSRDITETKRTTYALRMSEERLRFVSERAQVGYWHWDIEGDLLEWSSSCKELFGIPPQEPMSYERFMTALHPQDREGANRAVRACLEGCGQRDYDVEFRALRPDGTVRWIHAKGNAAFADGKPSRMAGIALDITERKQNELALQQKSTLLQGILESTPDPIFAKDIDCRMLMANSATLGTICRTSDEVLGRSEAEWAHSPQEAERILANDRRIMASGRPETIEEVFTAPGRAPRIFRSTKSPLRDAAGDVIGVVGVSQDVTALKEAEEALRSSEERFRALLTASSQIIYSVNPDWKVMRLLKGRDFLSGAEGETEAWLEKFIPAEDRSLVLETIATAIRAKGAFELEHRVRLAGDEVGWAFSRAVPILNERGEITEWFGAASDITERKRSEQALREASRRKNEFIAVLAHELRNPLSPIHNATLVLRKKRAPGDPDMALLDMIQRQTEHLVRLVDDLLEIGRISSGKIELRKEKSDIVGILRDALASCRPLIDSKAHRVITKIGSAPLWVLTDPVRMTQIVVNLIDNAVKYTPPDGLIEVEAAREADKIVLRVRDNGVGIADDALPQVFEPFMQAEKPADLPQKGLGIGLALARKLVELHEGSIEAHSAGPRCGSEFVVRLPQWQGQTSIAVEEITAPPAHDDEDDWLARVLIIDDDHDVGESFRLLMESLGLTVCVAYDGPAGIAAIDEFRPDAIFCDIGMPGIDGYETARRVRAAHGHSLFLIALTGWGQEEDRRRARQAGFDAHLTKPASINAIEALLREVRPGGSAQPVSARLQRTPSPG